jgi:lactate dehydrogenase-like 2-hydroxyacid dehydrogenase
MVNRAIDLECAKERKIVVSGTGGGRDSTVEHIWALVMAVVSMFQMIEACF